MKKLCPLDRFLLAFSLLLLCLFCLLAFLVGTGLLQSAFIHLFNACMAHWYNRLALCIAALIFLACAVRAVVVLSPKDIAPQAQAVAIKTTENGQIRMSLDALDTLVQKSVRSHASVRDVRSSEDVNEDGGIRISIKLSLAQDAVVPEVCQAVQQRVREFVQQHAGLVVAQVEILVYQVGSGTIARVE